MIGRFEHDMSEAVDALRQEKDRSAQTVEELNDKVILAVRKKRNTIFAVISAPPSISAPQVIFEIHVSKRTLYFPLGTSDE